MVRACVATECVRVHLVCMCVSVCAQDRYVVLCVCADECVRGCCCCCVCVWCVSRVCVCVCQVGVSGRCLFVCTSVCVAATLRMPATRACNGCRVRHGVRAWSAL